jgi:hypothetical protein
LHVFFRHFSHFTPICKHLLSWHFRLLLWKVIFRL